MFRVEPRVCPVRLESFDGFAGLSGEVAALRTENARLEARLDASAELHALQTRVLQSESSALEARLREAEQAAEHTSELRAVERQLHESRMAEMQAAESFAPAPQGSGEGALRSAEGAQSAEAPRWAELLFERVQHSIAELGESHARASAMAPVRTPEPPPQEAQEGGTLSARELRAELAAAQRQAEQEQALRTASERALTETRAQAAESREEQAAAAAAVAATEHAREGVMAELAQLEQQRARHAEDQRAAAEETREVRAELEAAQRQAEQAQEFYRQSQRALAEECAHLAEIREKAEAAAAEATLEHGPRARVASWCSGVVSWATWFGARAHGLQSRRVRTLQVRGLLLWVRSAVS